MRRRRLLALGALGAASAAGAWLGCSSSDGATPATPDGGADGGELDVGANDVGPPDATPPDPTAVSCANYCALVLANCTGDAAQYADPATCAKVCADLPLGDAGDTGGQHRRVPHLPRERAGKAVAELPLPARRPLRRRRVRHAPRRVVRARRRAMPGACDAACGTAFTYAPDAGEPPAAPPPATRSIAANSS